MSYPDDNIHFLGFPLTPETRVYPAQGCLLKKPAQGCLLKKPAQGCLFAQGCLLKKPAQGCLFAQGCSLKKPAQGCLFAQGCSLKKPAQGCLFAQGCSFRSEWRSHGTDTFCQRLSLAIAFSIPVPDEPVVEMSALCLQGVQYRAMNGRLLTTSTSLGYLLKCSLHLFQFDNFLINRSKLGFCKRLHFAAGRHFFLHLQG